MIAARVIWLKWLATTILKRNGNTATNGKIRNYRIKEDCPFQAKCLTKNAVYKAIIHGDNNDNTGGKMGNVILQL